MNIASEFLSETREPQSGIPSLGLQPPSMEFIDNDTRKYHPQFHPSVNYDHAAPKTPTRHSESVHPWNNIFPAAMKRLKEQPLLRLKPELRIRDKTSWEDVYVQLQRAQWVNKSNGEDRIMRPPKGDQWLFDHRAPGPIAAIINLLDVRKDFLLSGNAGSDFSN
ncbi:hypothetical protein THAR02_05308 [Trichoderma harzianum]|uniref:Uncharacterized protein n=1 Tax=Trichoderma harzianum TaxID=5544 RepID=A0A0F9XBP5_TRIHA|nr:hypothetical protein THAR02_05308 [Trichoderma harzianum]